MHSFCFRQMTFSAVTAATLLMASPARSAPIDGQSDPAFVSALALWLAGDEQAALPQLAVLAQDQNAAAQILLGLIDTTPALQGDWLMGQQRDDRIALLRAPGGLSGQNWMRTAAATEPLAQTWLALWNGDAPATVILDFARQDEARAARIAAMTLAKREKNGFAALADDPAYPAAARAFAVREWRRVDPPRAAREEASLLPADPQGEILGLRPEEPGATAAWLATNPEGDPLVALCAALCPDADQSACQTAAYQAIGGYWEVMALGSPAETIIPSDQFNQSRTGQASVLRALRGKTVENACLVDALQ
jgi:hypothetical protein